MSPTIFFAHALLSKKEMRGEQEGENDINIVLMYKIQKLKLKDKGVVKPV